MTLSAAKASEKMEIKMEPLSEDEVEHTETLPSSDNTPVMRLMPHIDYSGWNTGQRLKKLLGHKGQDDDDEYEDSQEDDSEKVTLEKDKKCPDQTFQKSENSGGSRPKKDKMKSSALFKDSDTSDVNRMTTENQTNMVEDYKKFVSQAHNRKDSTLLEVLLFKKPPKDTTMSQMNQSIESGQNASKRVSFSAMTETSHDENHPEDIDAMKIKSEPLSYEEQSYGERTYEEHAYREQTYEEQAYEDEAYDGDQVDPQLTMLQPYMDYSEANFRDSSEEDAVDPQDEDDEEWKASDEETEESVDEGKSQESYSEESDDSDDSGQDTKDRKARYKGKRFLKHTKMTEKPKGQGRLVQKTKKDMTEYREILSIAHGKQDVGYLQLLLSKKGYPRKDVKDLPTKRKESTYLKAKSQYEEKLKVIDSIRRRNLLPSTFGPNVPYPVIDSCAKLLQLENKSGTSTQGDGESSCQTSQSDPSPCKLQQEEKKDSSDTNSESAKDMLDGLNSRSCLLLQHLLVKEYKQPSTLVPLRSEPHSAGESVLRSMLTGKTNSIPTSSPAPTVPKVNATLLKNLLSASQAPLADFSVEVLLAKARVSERTQSPSPEPLASTPRTRRRTGKGEELSPTGSIEGYTVYVNKSCNEDDPVEDEGDDDGPDDTVPNVTIKSEPLSPSSKKDEISGTHADQDQVVDKLNLSPEDDPLEEERVSYTPAASCSEGEDNSHDETVPNVTIKSEPLSPSSNRNEISGTHEDEDSGSDYQVVVKQEPSPVQQDDRIDDHDERTMVEIKKGSPKIKEKRSLRQRNSLPLIRDSSLRSMLEDRNDPYQAFLNTNLHPNNAVNTSPTTRRRGRPSEPISASAQLMTLSKVSSDKQETILKGLVNGSSTSILGLDGSAQKHTHNTRQKRKSEGTSLLEKALKTLKPKPSSPANVDLSTPPVREFPQRDVPHVQPGYFSSKLSEAVLKSSSEARDSNTTSIPPVASCSQQLLNIIKNVGSPQQKPETDKLFILKTMLNDKVSEQPSRSDLNTETLSNQLINDQNIHMSSPHEISPRSTAFTSIPSQSPVRTNTSSFINSHTIAKESPLGNSAVEYSPRHQPIQGSPSMTSTPSQVQAVTECPYQCRICGNAFRSTALLEEHMQVHFGSMPFGCTLCPLSFMTGRELEEHISIHTNQLSPAVVFRCTVCGAVFDTAEEHNKHRISHEFNTSIYFNCNICNKGFATRELLQGHMKEHQTPPKEQTTEKYTGSCKHCDKEFNKHSKFVRHMNVHSALKEYKYKCDKCDKGFVTKTGMEGHVAKCNGPAYSCSGCHKTFIRKIELCAHFQDVHMVMGTRCEYCYKMFCFSYQKEEHLKEHEQDEKTISREGKKRKNSGIFAPLNSKGMKLLISETIRKSIKSEPSESNVQVISDSE